MNSKVKQRNSCGRYLPFDVVIRPRPNYKAPKGWVKTTSFRDLEFTYFNESRPRRVRIEFSSWKSQEGFEVSDPKFAETLEAVKFFLSGGPRGGHSYKRRLVKNQGDRSWKPNRGVWRAQAEELIRRGLTSSEIARQLKVSVGAVYQWVHKRKKLMEPLANPNGISPKTEFDDNDSPRGRVATICPA